MKVIQYRNYFCAWGLIAAWIYGSVSVSCILIASSMAKPFSPSLFSLYYFSASWSHPYFIFYFQKSLQKEKRDAQNHRLIDNFQLN